jgi:hypothetical protein
MDEYCQNLDAYPTARTIRVKVEDLPKKVYRGVGVTNDSTIDHMADVIEESEDASFGKNTNILGCHSNPLDMMPERSYVTEIWGDSAEHLKRRNNMRLYNNVLRDRVDKVKIYPTAPMFSFGERVGDVGDNCWMTLKVLDNVIKDVDDLYRYEPE